MRQARRRGLLLLQAGVTQDLAVADLDVQLAHALGEWLAPETHRWTDAMVLGARTATLSQVKF